MQSSRGQRSSKDQWLLSGREKSLLPLQLNAVESSAVEAAADRPVSSAGNCATSRKMRSWLRYSCPLTFGPAALLAERLTRPAELELWSRTEISQLHSQLRSTRKKVWPWKRVMQSAAPQKKSLFGEQ